MTDEACGCDRTPSRDHLLSLMVGDLKNEYTHMLFYLSNSATIRGLHRPELGEWLEEEAESEMGHVKQFSKLLRSLGGEPKADHHPIPTFACPYEIVKHAIHLEQEVCSNYAERLVQVDEFLDYLRKCREELGCGAVDGREFAAWSRVGLFYEDQLNHSHTDLDELREWLYTKDEHCNRP